MDRYREIRLMVQFHRKSINLHVEEIQNPDIRSSNRSLIYKYSDTRITSTSTPNRSGIYILHVYIYLYIYLGTELRGEFFETRGEK